MSELRRNVSVALIGAATLIPGCTGLVQRTEESIGSGMAALLLLGPTLAAVLEVVRAPPAAAAAYRIEQGVWPSDEELPTSYDIEDSGWPSELRLPTSLEPRNSAVELCVSRSKELEGDSFELDYAFLAPEAESTTCSAQYSAVVLPSLEESRCYDIIVSSTERSPGPIMDSLRLQTVCADDLAAGGHGG